MGFSVSEKQARIDRRSPPPESDSGASDKSLAPDRDFRFNSMGFSIGLNNSPQNTYIFNPKLDGNCESGESSTTVNMVDPLSSKPTSFINVLLKENAAFLAGEFTRLKSSSEFDTKGKAPSKDSLDLLHLMNQERSDSILKSFHDMNLDTDNKDENFLALVNELEDLRNKIKERKRWAAEKEMQAANKLCNDIMELKILRNEREKYQQIKKKNAEDVPQFMKYVDVEIALRRAIVQVNRANLDVRRLDVENKEIKADIVAYRLSTYESFRKWFEAAARENKHVKKVLDWEKHKEKLQESIKSEKQKLLQLQEEIVETEAARKAGEARWREEQEAKEHALERVKQERSLKEETVSINKQIQDSLRAKFNLDLKLHKDDIGRLKQELTRVESGTNQDLDLTNLFGTSFDDDIIGKLLHGTGDDEDDEDDRIEIDRECVMCCNDEVSVVFLPCAHQVLCGECNEDMRKKGEVKCVICGVDIEERILVAGLRP